MLNAAKLAAAPARPGPSARVALGALGLAALFGLGYQIGLRRLTPWPPRRPGLT